MAEYAPDNSGTTICCRNEEMISFAKRNLAKYDSRKQITLVWEGAMQQRFCKIWTLGMILFLWTQPGYKYLSSFCLKSKRLR